VAIIFEILFVVCTVLMILLILIQKGRGAGLAGAFGGGGGSSAFGTKTADVLTKITAGFAVAFFLLSIVSGMYLKSKTTSESQAPQRQQGPVRPQQPSPGPGTPSEQPSPAAPAGTPAETPAAK
jgi:preprotein translocase subunit SecG